MFFQGYNTRQCQTSIACPECKQKLVAVKA